MQTIINICLRKNKSKQSYVWIDSIFEAQNICFGTEKVSLLDFSYNKCALAVCQFFEKMPGGNDFAYPPCTSEILEN